MEPERIEAAALLRPLARQPLTPPAVDIDKAIADGTRRQRTLRAAGSGAVALATLAVLAGGWAVVTPQRGASDGTPSDNTAASASGGAAPEATGPTPPTSCAVQVLEMPAGQPPMSVVSGGDPSGRYVVGRSYPGNSRTPRMLIWDHGKVTAVAMQGEDQLLRDITSTGVAVGTSYVGDGTETAAWVYRDGVMSRLIGRHAEANGINESGVIVGAVNDRPALWRSATSQPTMLATPGGAWVGQAMGIDEDGTVVGVLGTDLGTRTGYLWRPDGTAEKLPTPQVRGKPATMYTADSIRNGWVAGWARLDERSGGRPTDDSKPARGGGVGDISYIAAPRWNLRTGAVETPDGIQLAEAINRHGWMVGSGPGPVLFAEGRTVRLPAPRADAGPQTSIVYTVSDDGRVLAGQVELANGDPAGAMWRCS
jgi:hypothetical protein